MNRKILKGKLFYDENEQPNQDISNNYHFLPFFCSENGPNFLGFSWSEKVCRAKKYTPSVSKQAKKKITYASNWSVLRGYAGHG